jgi:hypothetical protein
LSEQELESLEQQVGLPMPSELREYFSLVGLFQDLTGYDGSEYEVHEQLEDLTLSRKFLVENFGHEGARFFPFAGDGAGDEIAAAEVEGKLKLFFADHETLEITEIGLFSEWLSGVVDAALKSRKTSNHQKKWCVQFSFKTPKPEPILEILRNFEQTTFGNWSEEKVMPSGVHVSEAPFTFGRRQLTLTKSDNRHPWAHPNFSFSFHEPVTLTPSESLIRKLDAAFRSSDLGYKLVDYGPLVVDSSSDEEEVELSDDAELPHEKQKSRKRPLWKFW